jgi:hypothetical protein
MECEPSVWAQTVPTWLAAVGTVIAGGVAAGVVVRDSTERRAGRVERRRSQALQVSFEPKGAGASSVDTLLMRHMYSVVVSNDSGHAIEDVRVHGQAVPVSAEGLDRDRIEREETVKLGSIFPGTRKSAEFVFVLPRVGNDRTLHTAIFDVSFIDNDGIRWQRTNERALVELKDK